MARKFLSYFKYFFYLGWNWNFRLASAILYYEIKGEKKYRISTIGTYDLNTSVSEKDRKHASIYQPVNYYIGEWLFKQLEDQDIRSKSFLDAGCGKGRAMVMAAHFGFKEVSGFDISPKMCNEAITNINKVQCQFPGTKFEVVCSDARTAIISDNIGVIFLFNPFAKIIMKVFITRVMDSLKKNPRNLMVLYANPECRDLWEAAGFEPINQIEKLYWLQGLVLFYQPPLEKGTKKPGC
jgi:SAM-dependent methyltransferase